MEEIKKSNFNVDAKIISSIEKVLPDESPSAEEYSSVMLKNEQLNFQLVYTSAENHTLTRNYVKVAGDLGEYVTLRLVENVPVEYTPYYSDDYYISKKSGLYPDLLSSMPDENELGITLMPNKNRAIWVSVFSKKGLPSGKHNLKFLLFSHENELISELVYTIEVLNLKAVSAPIKTTTWMHYDSIFREHEVKPFSARFYKIFAEYLKAYVHCGMNMLLTPIFTPPLDTEVGAERLTAQLVVIFVDESGKYSFDFSPLEKFIKFAFKRGIKYIEFSHFYTQWGGNYCPKIMASTPKGYKRIFGWDVNQKDERYVQFLNAFLPELIKTTDKLGVTEKCYFHLTDEPEFNEKTIENYKFAHQTVKKHLAGRPIMDAMSHTWFYENGLVDLPVVYTANVKEFKEKGINDVFAYYCCGPANQYYSNRFINMPALRTRILGAQLYQSGVSGFLHWGFNFYNSQYSIIPINPYRVTDSGGCFPGGDGFMVYPSKSGVLLSIRAELFCEAIQDYNLLYTLEKLAGKTVCDEILKKYGIQGYNVYPRDEKTFLKFKSEIYAALSKFLLA